jgi:hypothetical protein
LLSTQALSDRRVVELGSPHFVDGVGAWAESLDVYL